MQRQGGAGSGQPAEPAGGRLSCTPRSATQGLSCCSLSLSCERNWDTTSRHGDHQQDAGWEEGARHWGVQRRWCAPHCGRQARAALHRHSVQGVLSSLPPPPPPPPPCGDTQPSPALGSLPPGFTWPAGEALAAALAAESAFVRLTARSEDALRATADRCHKEGATGVAVHPCNLADGAEVRVLG